MKFLFTILALVSSLACAGTHDCRDDLLTINQAMTREGFENQGIHFQDGLIVTAYEKGHGSDIILMVFVFTSDQANAEKAVKNGYSKIETTCEIDGLKYQPWVKIYHRKNARS